MLNDAFCLCPKIENQDLSKIEISGNEVNCFKNIVNIYKMFYLLRSQIIDGITAFVSSISTLMEKNIIKYKYNYSQTNPHSIDTLKFFGGISCIMKCLKILMNNCFGSTITNCDILIWHVSRYIRRTKTHSGGSKKMKLTAFLRTTEASWSGSGRRCLQNGVSN